MRPSAVKAPTNPIEALFTPPKPRGTPEQALAAAAVRHEAEYFVPIEHHNPMELYASTVIFEGDGKLTVYDKTQGVQNVQRYLCGVFGMKPDDVRVMSPFMGGGFGSGLRPQFQVVLAVLAARALQRSVRVVLTRAADVCAGLPARDDPAHRARRQRRRNARRDHARRDHRDLAIRGLPSAGDRLVRPALQVRQREIRAQARAARSRRPRATCARPSAATGVYALECAMDELAVALKLDPLELRLRCYSDRDQNDDRPYSSKALRECYRQGAEAFGWDKRNPEPRSMRDGSELVGWGMATGVWEALQMPITVRIVLTANGHAEVACATSDIGTGTYTIMAQVAADMLGLPLDNISIKLGDSSAAAIAGRRRIVDRGLGVERDRDDGRRDPRRAAAPGQADAEFAARGRRAGRRRARGRQAREQARRLARGVDRRRDAARRRRPHRAGEDHQSRRGRAHARTTRIRRSSPR